jgi:hypothetical protein
MPDSIVNYSYILDPYAVAARYPDDNLVVDSEKYNLAINAAEETLKWVTSKIQHLLEQRENAENKKKISENCNDTPTKPRMKP